jgi:hypothetical protein
MNRLIQVALAAALAASISASAKGETRTAVSEQGGQVVAFNIGDSSCELRDNQVQCTRVER